MHVVRPNVQSLLFRRRLHLLGSRFIVDFTTQHCMAVKAYVEAQSLRIIDVSVRSAEDILLRHLNSKNQNQRTSQQICQHAGAPHTQHLCYVSVVSEYGKKGV